jgi:integrative and conjugative element protein (TIGR02256 family)
MLHGSSHTAILAQEDSYRMSPFEPLARRSGGPSVLITDAALGVMFGLRQAKDRDKEAGGQLFAHFNGSDVVILEATRPTILDRRSRHSFKPNRFLQRREIRKKHAAGLHFVGDWHTHPETTATPSNDDLTSMQDCFRRSRHDLTAFILIIVGIAPPPDGWYVALVTADGVQRLSSIASDDRKR